MGEKWLCAARLPPPAVSPPAAHGHWTLRPPNRVQAMVFYAGCPFLLEAQPRPRKWPMPSFFLSPSTLSFLHSFVSNFFYSFLDSVFPFQDCEVAARLCFDCTFLPCRWLCLWPLLCLRRLRLQLRFSAFAAAAAGGLCEHGWGELVFARLLQRLPAAATLTGSCGHRNTGPWQ